MRLIAGLESSPREIYTGAIGVVEPGRKASFSIAIRTARFDHRSDTAVYGAGGGIVWDSRTDDEWDELLAKAQVVNRPPRPEIEIFETLRFSPSDGYFLRHLHRDRLASSAHWFGWPFDPAAFDRLLDKGAYGLRASARVRVRLRSNGRLSLQSSPFQPESPSLPSIRLVSLPAGTDPVFLHHKTSVRNQYDPDGSGREWLFFNNRGRVTESSIANLVYEMEGERFTPPVTDGLLPGVWRRHLLEQGRVRERSLAVGELPNLSRIWLVNALRGEREVFEVLDTQGRRCFAR
jgi:para-aminobenzoate synthetase/4-amino-4-deoxychorismate lyase